MKKALLFVIIVTLILLSLDIAVFSRVLPDLERNGSVSVTMRYGGNPVPGGTMTLYRVGDVVIEDGNCIFKLTEHFAELDLNLSDLESDQLVFDVAGHIDDNNIDGVTKDIDANGRVIFEALEPGLYMLIQKTAATGYNCSNPFLVSLPMNGNDEYIYDVDASAKAELTKNNDNPYDDTTPDSDTSTGGRDTTGGRVTTSGGNRLPQTGQLKWPIPILTVAGAGFVLVGMLLCFGSKRTHNEN
ncbi:MAG: hypothetical protein IJA55_00290 [Clostridia bacterium]|nr:hypothetical protein [Clostridia bacterium]